MHTQSTSWNACSARRARIEFRVGAAPRCCAERVGHNARVPRSVARSTVLLAAFVAALPLGCARAQNSGGAIDELVQLELTRRGLSANGAADPGTWLRRVSLDLIGLPPTPAQLDAFLADDRPGARGRVVDRLLADPAYGERWATWWLDLARYADSQGYEKDGLRRTMWRYRDWVIDALQRDLPFDEFSITQLAGDLLPNATVEQQLATAFHRNTMTNTEGGTDDEEFRTAAVIDRVDTTMSVWMGATVGCAQCHDHKYDPISQREFFGIYAFFNQTGDSDKGNDAPLLNVASAAERERAQELEAEIAELRATLVVDDVRVERMAAGLRAAIVRLAAADVESSDWHLLGPVKAASFDAAHATEFAAERDGVRLDDVQDGTRWQARPDLVDGKVHTWQGNESAFYLHRTLTAKQAATAVLSLGSDDAIKVWWNGESVLDNRVARGARADQELVEVDLRPGRNELLLKVSNGGGPGGFYFDLRATRLGSELERRLASESEASAAALAALRDRVVELAPEFDAVRARIAAAERELADTRGPAVPVMQELPADEQRTTRLLLRGSFLTPGEEVEPHTPACWPPMADELPKNRLGFARWLLSPDNPRTAKVVANRIWAELFGRGLVPTLEDFGSQGEPCSHPELLDWLGDEFVRVDWSLKRLLRTIVLSETYGRSSDRSTTQQEQDPENVWLARGPAFRLNGELLRDQALAVSGLLSRKRFGPSVMPPQPDGVWQQIYSGAKWQTATDEDRYRRSLYTFWRRLSPHPAMMLLDAQTREFCVLRRQRTNTPLQALVMWNDPQFHEAAVALAARAREAVPEGGADRVRWLWRQCLLREPTDSELRRLLALAVAERTQGADETLCWNVLASVVMNLDEFVTKR